MEIRKIQGIIISSILLVGLAGCSSSSTYSGDDSPWKSKRSSERSNEEFVEVGLEDSLEATSIDGMPTTDEMMSEPEMMESPELESISDFDPEPAPVEGLSAFEQLELNEATPVIEEAPSAVGSDIMSASPSAYVVQVYAGRNLANVKRYISSHGLDNMQIVKTKRNGDVIYVLVGLYANRASAKQALIDLEQSTGSTPWIRQVSELQNIVAQ
ncbi:MAG: SPOR domain-containing protein [Gammaproteobacteria bacterium]|nr:SPOR domain-containing protein [Gammaproteobacteria bacterium]